MPNKRTKSKPNQKVSKPSYNVFSGYLSTNEKNSSLRGVAKYQTFDNILCNTSIVAASVRFITTLATKAQWGLKPADDSQEAEKLKDRTEKLLFDEMKTPWHKVVKSAFTHKVFGFSLQEVVNIKHEDGVIGIHTITSIPQVTVDRWDIDEFGEIQGVWQNNVQTFHDIYIDRHKMIYVVDDTMTDSPEGLGLFRHLVEPVDRLNRYLQLEGFSFEADLRGVPVFKAPIDEMTASIKQHNPDLNDDQIKAEVDKILQNCENFAEGMINSDAMRWIMLDSGSYTGDNGQSGITVSSTSKWDISLLQSDSSGQKEIAEAINRIIYELARILGSEGLLLGSGTTGSQALSKDVSQRAALMIDSALAEIREALQKDLIDRIWMDNGWPDELKPKFTVEQTRVKDVSEISQMLVDFAQAGVPLQHDDPIMNTLRGWHDLPDAPEISEQDLGDMGINVSVDNNRNMEQVEEDRQEDGTDSRNE